MKVISIVKDEYNWPYGECPFGECTSECVLARNKVGSFHHGRIDCKVMEAYTFYDWKAEKGTFIFGREGLVIFL